MVQKYRIIRSVEPESRERGYSVIYNSGVARGRKVMVGFYNEANWFPTMKEAMEYKRECEEGE